MGGQEADLVLHPPDEVVHLAQRRRRLVDDDVDPLVERLERGRR